MDRRATTPHQTESPGDADSSGVDLDAELDLDEADQADEDDLDDDDFDDEHDEDDEDDEDEGDGDEAGAGDGDDAVAGEEFGDVDEYLDTVINRAASARSRSRERRDAEDQRLHQAEREQAHASGCAPCVHAAEHGWWGDITPARAHCSGCHRSWRSFKEGHCTLCHRQFHNQPAFDAHLTTDACRDPGVLSRQDGRPRFRTAPTPFGDVWRLVNYRDLPDFASMGH